MGCFSSADVRRLLHNKYVAVLGDSIQRSVYKDLVKLLQDDNFLTDNQLRKKGEMSFANDVLVEGGSLAEMHNGINYREVRQYQTGFHLVRFYFLTRVYSEYVESVLADFKEGPQPDVLILNSCIWDLIRYDYQPLEFYKTNLDRLFSRLTEVLPPDCLVIWNMTMPVGYKDGEVQEYPNPNLRWDIIAGNFYSATLANLHKMDVLDMHYHFRFDLRARTRDSIHWNQLAHRKYTQILMAHIAQAWGVQAPETPIAKCHPIKSVPLVGPLRKVPQRRPPFNDQENSQHHFGHAIHAAPPPPPPPVVSLRNVPHFPPQENRNHFGPMFLPGYTSFDDNGDSDMIGTYSSGRIRFHPNEMNPNAFSPFVEDSPLLVNNLPPRNVNFGGYGKITNVNFTVPMFDHRLFNGIPIAPQHLAVPDFSAFPYNTSMPQEAWSGHHRFPKRNMRSMPGWNHPYYRYSPFPTRI